MIHYINNMKCFKYTMQDFPTAEFPTIMLFIKYLYSAIHNIIKFINNFYKSI